MDGNDASTSLGLRGSSRDRGARIRVRTPRVACGGWASPIVQVRVRTLISSVVVSYQVRPDAVAEHVRLIKAIFAQLTAEQTGNVEYKVMCLDDGVSFVHVSTADTPDGSNPLPDLTAFREFGKDSAARVATPPVPKAAEIIGSYRPAGPGLSTG